VLVVVVLAIALLTHRNAGDVGAAADLADARRIVEQRAAGGDDFDAINRGRFVADLQLTLPVEASESWVTAVRHGHFDGDGTSALEIELRDEFLTATARIEVELASGANGLVVVWPGRDADADARASTAADLPAELRDLRSGRVLERVAPERLDRRLVIALPAAYDPDRSWSYDVRISARDDQLGPGG
jgi:hypothetical protein